MAPQPPRRVLPPASPAPAHAWLETESDQPLEQCRLLDALPPSPSPIKTHRKSSLQAGLTLTVWGSSKKYSKCPVASESGKPEVKTTFQKRKEKLISVLKPPYYILFMIIIIAFLHVVDSRAENGVGRIRVALEWTGMAAWWRQPWRVFSYSLVHASTMHLALNALVALALGWRLEAEQKWWRVALVWWGGVGAGSLAAGALQPRVTVVGASAAVYALLTAHLSNVCLRFGHIPLWWFRPLSVFVLGLSEISCYELQRAHLIQEKEVRIAWSAHALGAAVGLPLAFLVFTGEQSSRTFVRVIRWVSGAALATFVVLCALHDTNVLPHLPPHGKY